MQSYPQRVRVISFPYLWVQPFPKHLKNGYSPMK